MLKNTKKGFTLIELLVVIAIIGILASIVLASLNTARMKSRDARRLADIKQIQIALELYFDANSSSYPPTGTGTGQGLGALTTGGFMSTVPKDPIGARSYAYELCVPSTGAKYYHVGASLEDGASPALLTNSDNSYLPGCPGAWGANASACTTGDTGTHCYDITP